MELIKPKALKKGDTIGVFAPSSCVYKEQPEQIKEFIESRGYKVYIHPQTYKRDGQFAGTSDEKVAALHALFSDPKIDAILCVRGGNGAIHMLDKIDYNLIRKNPKIFIGYSDITVLLNAFCLHAGVFSFHGPSGTDYLPDKNEVTYGTAFKNLSGDFDDDLFMHGINVKSLKAGKSSGRLIGGNLATFSGLLVSGDAYIPNYEGSILVLEDVGEELSRMDRVLGGMRLAGIFDKISGLIFGASKEAPCASRSFPFGRSLEQVILENTTGTDIPIVTNAPFGHEQPNIVFPIGGRAQLDATMATPTLTLLESPFAP